MQILLLAFLFLANVSYAGVSFETINEFGLLATASYNDTTKVSDRLAETDYVLDHRANLSESGISYFVAHKKLADKTNLQAIAFRGTSNLENVLVDLNLALVHDPKLGVSMHKGFSEAAMAAYNDLGSFLDKSSPIVITGHSLGGAIAQIVALHLQQDGFMVKQVVTFGQPKVTNVTGAALFETLPLMRVVTVKDIVPLVPPLSPMQIKNLDVYWHSGEEILLLPGKNYSVLTGLKSMMRATKFFNAVPDEGNLDAHKMTSYMYLIKSKLIQANQVVYKTGVSFFGFNID